MDFVSISIADATAPPARTIFAATPSGTSASRLFSSASSLASGLTGGGKVGSTLGLVYVDVVEKNCGGVIQTSDHRRFCCKAAGACSTKGHKTKLNLSTKTLYVKHSRTGQARISPKLSVDLLPNDVTVAELLIQDNSLEVWVAYFESLHAENRKPLHGFPLRLLTWRVRGKK
jgi:hypothetical protein